MAYHNNNKGNKPFRPRNTDNGVTGLTVEVRNGDFGKAMRIFKKKVQDAGIMQEIRDRQHYVKPSEVKRKAKQAGRKRYLKAVEKRKQEHGF